MLVKGRPYMSCEELQDLTGIHPQQEPFSWDLLPRMRPPELAKVFGVHVNSVQRHLTDFERQGMGGLLSGRSGPEKRWKLTPGLRGRVRACSRCGGSCTKSASWGRGKL